MGKPDLGGFTDAIDDCEDQLLAALVAVAVLLFIVLSGDDNDGGGETTTTAAQTRPKPAASLQPSPGDNCP